MRKISVFVFFFIYSCATILNKKNQKITIKSNLKVSTIFLDNKVISKDSIALATVKLERKVHVISYEAPGYEKQQKCIMPYKNTLAFKASCFLIVPSFGFAFSLDKYYEKDKKFPKIVTFNPPTKISTSPSSLKSIDIDKIVINENSNVFLYKYNRYMKNKVELFSPVKENNSTYLKIETDRTVNELLKNNIQKGLFKEICEYGYGDSNFILRNNRNMLTISPTVNIINNCILEQKVEEGVQKIGIFKSKVKITWDLKDYIGNILYSFNTEEISDDFPMNSGDPTKNLINNTIENTLTYHKAIENCLHKSLHKLFNVSEINKFRALETHPTISGNTTYFEIKQSDKIKNNNELDSVIVKIVNGDFVGSGTVIGDSGEIVTSAVFCQDTSNLKVIMNNKKEYPAKLLHIDINNNLALLKIDYRTSKVVELCNDELKLANTIFAGGLSSKDATNPSISKGIVSAIRTIDGSKSIQISSKLSYSYLGGPLLNKEGKLVGILNFKIEGNSIEGLGFATPVQYLTEWIKIK